MIDCMDIVEALGLIFVVFVVLFLSTWLGTRHVYEEQYLNTDP